MSFFTAPIRILAVAGICVLALIGLVVSEARARASGTEIVMAMQPIDPRSLLSGHYVIVSLQEQLPEGAPCPDSMPGDGSGGPWVAGVAQEWVAIGPRGAHHGVTGVGTLREVAASFGPIVARGNSSCSAPTATFSDGSTPTEPQRASIFTDLGVERFHIDQANAERIERLMRETAMADEAQVFAILSITQDGRARLKGLLVEGERLELSLY